MIPVYPKNNLINTVIIPYEAEINPNENNIIPIKTGKSIFLIQVFLKFFNYVISIIHSCFVHSLLESEYLLLDIILIILLSISSTFSPVLVISPSRKIYQKFSLIIIISRNILANSLSKLLDSNYSLTIKYIIQPIHPDNNTINNHTTAFKSLFLASL